VTRNRASAKAAGSRFEPHPCLGCGNPTPPQSMGQPRKWCSDECRARTRNKRRRKSAGPRPLAERLAAKLARDGDCTVFVGHRNEHGYGVIRSDEGRTMLAHRAAYEVHRGPIPDGMHVLHRCDNPPCCDPGHLWIGTHIDNMRDRDAKGRTLRGAELRKARWGR